MSAFEGGTQILHCDCGRLIYFEKDEQHSIKERTEQNRLNETVNNNFKLHTLAVAPESVKIHELRKLHVKSVSWKQPSTQLAPTREGHTDTHLL